MKATSFSPSDTLCNEGSAWASNLTSKSCTSSDEGLEIGEFRVWGSDGSRALYGAFEGSPFENSRPEGAFGG